MKIIFYLTLILLINLFNVHGIQDNLIQSVEIEEVTRNVDLTSRYIETQVSISLSNKGKTPLKYFYYTLPNELVSNCVIVLLEQGESNEQSVSSKIEDVNIKNKFNASLYEFKLLQDIPAGKKGKITLKETFFRRFSPLPKAITLTEDQRVVFFDNKYFYSPYRILRQRTYYKARNIISFTQEPKSKTVKSSVLYGDYDDVEPYSTSQIKIHSENNIPLVILTKAVKKIEISHWGNIAISSTYKIKNEGAEVAGEYGRVVYNKYNPQAGKNALKSLYAELPYHAWGVWYQDEIGNISTSNAWRSREEKVVKLNIEPRFGILGGWKSNWELGYNLNTSRYLFTNKNQDQYTLKQPFGFPFHELIADEYEVQIHLPEGSKNISVNLPFEIDEKLERTSYSYLDTTGRPVIILKKNHVTEFHNQNFYVNYSLNQMDILKKPLLILSAFLIFFFGMIFLGRIQFKTFETGNSQ